MQWQMRHKIFGCKNVGIGCIPGAEGPEWLIILILLRNSKTVGKKLFETGHYFMYHNNMKFAKSDNGKIIFASRWFSPNELGFTLIHTGYRRGGGDPAWVDKHFSGRVPCAHLKDMACVDSSDRMAPVGEGISILIQFCKLRELGHSIFLSSRTTVMVKIRLIVSKQAFIIWKREGYSIDRIKAGIIEANSSLF